MRLIDVNKLNECLFIHKGKICPNRDIDNFPITMTVEDVKSAISKQPTAYDVDKVLEHLKELNKYNLNLADCMLDIQSHGLNRHFVCLEDAIEIVKAGGIDGN
jgi:hypothetical protein